MVQNIKAIKSNKQSNPPAISAVSNEHSFRYTLNQWYRMHHDVSLKDTFQTVQHLEHDLKKIINGEVAAAEVTGSTNTTRAKHLWTATFLCPVTGETSTAGKLPGIPNRDLLKGVDGTYFYLRKKHALQAAAMTALDQFCRGGEGVDEQDEDDGDAESSSDEQESLSSLGLSTEAAPVSPDIFIPEANHESSSPRSQLNVWYMRKYQVCLTNSSFKYKKKQVTGFSPDDHGGLWWSAVLTCPVYSRVFTCPEAPSSSSGLLDIDPTRQNVDDDGTCWFRSKSEATQAVTQAALDYYLLDNVNPEVEVVETLVSVPSPTTTTLSDELSDEIVKPLYGWYEETHGVLPTDDHFVVSSTSQPDEWTASMICPVESKRYDAGVLPTDGWTIVSTMDGLNWYDTPEKAKLAAAFAAMQELLPNEPTLRDHNEAPDEESGALTSENVVDSDVDEDEFVIEMIPQRADFSSLHKSHENLTSNTLDLIAEAWTDSSDQGAKDTTQAKVSPWKRREQAISRAYSWLSQQNENREHELEDPVVVFDIGAHTNSLKVSNLLLDSLAASHELLPFSHSKVGVEVAAKAILDYMWSTSTSHPDANSYAAYIRCWEGNNPTALAKRAIRFWQLLKEGKQWEERQLPDPNVTLYNSILKRQAEAGIRVLPKDFDSVVEPNLQTFQTCLSSEAYAVHNSTHGHVFDIEYARDMMQQIRTLLAEEPEAVNFNIPVPLGGGQIGEKSKYNARTLPWDQYHEIFKRGFRSMDHESTAWRNALAIDSWYESNSSQETDNTIASSERRLQAWIRTGTREGVEKAEEIARAILENSDGMSKVGLRTFHPILASWTYSGADDSVSKLDEWISVVSSAIPEAAADSRLRLAAMLSRLATQYAILHNDQGNESKETSDHIRGLSSSCDKLIDTFYLNTKEPKLDYIFESDVFSIALEACYLNASNSSQNAQHHEASLAKLTEIAEAYEKVLKGAFGPKGSASKEQKICLLQNSSKVYMNYLTSVVELDSLTDDDDEEEDQLDVSKSFELAERIAWIEEKVRRSEEFASILETMDSELVRNQNAADLLTGDLFTFEAREWQKLAPRSAWDNFYEKALQTLLNWSAHGSSDPEASRLCLLIARLQGSCSSQQSIISKSPTSVALVKATNSVSAKHNGVLQQVVRDLQVMHKQNQKVPYPNNRGQKQREEETQEGEFGVDQPFLRRRRVRARSVAKKSRPTRKGPSRTTSGGRTKKSYAKECN